MNSKKLYLLSILLSGLAFYFIDNLWIYWVICGVIALGMLNDLADYLIQNIDCLAPPKKYKQSTVVPKSKNDLLVYQCKARQASPWDSYEIPKPRVESEKPCVKSAPLVIPTPSFSAMPKMVEEKKSEPLIVAKDSWTKGREFELAFVNALRENKNSFLGGFSNGKIIDYHGSDVDLSCKVDVVLECENTNFLFQCKGYDGFGYAQCKNINVERDIISKKYDSYFKNNKDRGYIIIFKSTLKVFDKNGKHVEKTRIKDVMDEYFIGINDGKGLLTNYLFLDTETLSVVSSL